MLTLQAQGILRKVKTQVLEFLSFLSIPGKRRDNSMVGADIRKRERDKKALGLRTGRRNVGSGSSVGLQVLGEDALRCLHCALCWKEGQAVTVAATLANIEVLHLWLAQWAYTLYLRAH